MTFKVKKKKPRLTKKKIDYFIEDEKKASAEYKKYGFPQLAKDEKNHQRFFESLKKKRKTMMT